MIFAAWSTSFAFRSWSFASAISRTWAALIDATLLRFGSPEPFWIPAASLIRTAAGGVLVMKVNERCSKTVISTGMIRPFWSWVCALNALQNSMMFTPCWPSAGPTGGARLAAPPGTWSLIRVRTFLAMRRVGRLARVGRTAPSNLLDLVEAHFHRRLAPEDRDEHLQLRGVFIYLGDLARE